MNIQQQIDIMTSVIGETHDFKDGTWSHMGAFFGDGQLEEIRDTMKKMLILVKAAQAVDREFFSIKDGFVQISVRPIADLKQALAAVSEDQNPFEKCCDLYAIYGKEHDPMCRNAM